MKDGSIQARNLTWEMHVLRSAEKTPSVKVAPTPDTPNTCE